MIKFSDIYFWSFDQERLFWKNLIDLEIYKKQSFFIKIIHAFMHINSKCQSWYFLKIKQ